MTVRDIKDILGLESCNVYSIKCDGSTFLFIAFCYNEYAPKNKSTMLVSSYYIDGQIFYNATNSLCKRLNELGYVTSVDSNINIKHLAESNGIGACGYNTLLAIKGIGSRTYLSILRTTADISDDICTDSLTYSMPCESCRKCSQACPNGAISEGGHFNFQKCLRHYMFSSEIVPEDIRPLFGNRFLGCDECQLCCPVNSKKVNIKLYYPDDLEYALNVEGLLTDLLANKKERLQILKSYLGKNYLTKTKAVRATLIVAGNSGDKALLPVIKEYFSSDDELVREYACYSYNRISDKRTD